LWLMGGGFALARAIASSGLAEFIGEQLVSIKTWPPEALLLLVLVLIVWLTEFVNNTAASQIFITILASISSEILVHPFYLCVPAALATSFAFCLPTATAPNAIVFATNKLRITDMIKTGVLLNIIMSLLVYVMWLALGPVVYNARARDFPEWGFLNDTSVI